ncbi:MAG: HPr family phosphocarrier protein [Micrococcales bacterium]
MASFEFVVANPDGLHARPAAELVRLASTPGFQVTVGRPNQPPVNANSILSLLALGIRSGERIVVSIDGENTEPLAQEIGRIFA